jgi:type IV secretory pathway VirJ component
VTRRAPVLALAAVLWLSGGAGVPGGQAPQLQGRRAAQPRRGLPDLPLIEIPAPAGARPTPQLAVLLTGDGGWATTDRGLSRALAKNGIPVVGWNSLRYFLHRRNPEGTTRDLERILRWYLPAWRRERAVLIGYSFGADVMPFLVHRLPEDLRARISLVALLGPDEKAVFRFHLSEWLGKESRDTLPVRPEIEALRGLPILCAYGQQEARSLCKELAPGLARVLVRPGSHIIGKEYGGIVAEILKMVGLPPAPPAGGRGSGRRR